MPHQQSENLQLNIPDETHSMADFDLFLTQNWDKIEAAANPPIIAAPPLPQSGDYVSGDRIYLESLKSVFLCWTVDPFWGIIWRPVEAAISPWTTVPATAFKHADYDHHPDMALQFATDNRGNCHWRGAIRNTLTAVPNANSVEILYNLPDGLRHHTSGMFSIAIDPISGVDTPETLAQYHGGRWYIQDDGYNSFRFHNPFGATDVHVAGVTYPASNKVYYST